MERSVEERVLEWLHYIYSNDTATAVVLNVTEFRRRLLYILDTRFGPAMDGPGVKAGSGNANFYRHAFEFHNITEHNITQEYVNDFLEKLFQSLNRLNRTTPELPDADDVDAVNCSDYCKGAVREILLEYKLLHGYISLVADTMEQFLSLVTTAFHKLGKLGTLLVGVLVPLLVGPRVSSSNSSSFVILDPCGSSRICFFGTIANILNIIVLTRKDMTKVPINRILKWLSVTDMFVMLEYIPFAFYMYLILPDRRDYPYSWAVYLMFHMHFTQILHTISILLTVTLAIWRYIAIKHPHGSLAIYAQSNYGQAIALCYILAPILCFPTYFVFTIRETFVFEGDTQLVLYHLDTDESAIVYRYNFWIHSVIIKLLPCTILTVISCVLIQVLWKASKRRLKLKQGGNYAKNGAPSVTPQSGGTSSGAPPVTNGNRHPKTDRRADRTTTLLVAVLLLFLFTEFPQGILGLMSGMLEKCFFRRCYGLFGEVMDLLALINAAIGFVLYGLMSKQFRTSFKSVFFKTPTHRAEITRMTGITTTCV